MERSQSRYSLVAWRFNVILWAATMQTAIAEIGLTEFAAIIDVTPKTLEDWSKGRVNSGYPHPHMTNFLKALNWLDLDPRDYFELEDV